MGKIPTITIKMLLQRLNMEHASHLCEALEVSQVLAYQYHQYCTSFEYSDFINKPRNDSLKSKVVIPNLAKALFQNSGFLALADANQKVKVAALSQDLELLKNALKDTDLDPNGWYDSPLRIACRFGQLDVFKIHVDEYGMDISAHKNAALCEACQYGHLEIVQYILSHPNFNPVDCSNAFISAFEHIDVSRLLLGDKRFDPSFNNNQVIIEAATKKGYTDIFKLFLADPRVDPAARDNQAIINAAKRGNVGILKLLLADSRVNPSDQDNQAIIEAIKDAEIVKLLMSDPRVNPSDQNNQALIKAAKDGHTEKAKLLMSDPRVNPADQKNQALINATKNGDAEMVKILTSDPRVDPTDRYSLNPIDIAVAKRDRDICWLLTRGGKY